MEQDLQTNRTLLLVGAFFFLIFGTEIVSIYPNNSDATIRWCREFGLITETINYPLCAKTCIQQNYLKEGLWQWTLLFGDVQLNAVKEFFVFL